MASELEEAWKKMKLMEEEEEAVICDEEVDERMEYKALCLWGILVTENHFNVGAMKTILKNVWKPVKGVIIRELDKNLFAFQFFSQTDKNYVLNEGTWAFDDNILLLKELSGLEHTIRNSFQECHILGQILRCATIEANRSLCSLFGIESRIFSWL